MTSELLVDDSAFLPSVFWRDLNRKNLRLVNFRRCGHSGRSINNT
jgi:hypothetical protein